MNKESSNYIQAENRKQQMFFPPSIDEYISSDNPVRAIDDYVELLDIKELGFKSNKNILDGRPAYSPKLLLKIYIYGYLNRIRSSRKLEREIQRNIELMWLCSNLKPSYKTISDFRRDNSKALKRVFREFTLLCKNIDLISGDIVAVDGAFLRANASKNQLLMKKTIEKDIKKIDERVEEYLKDLDYIDAKEKKDKDLTPPSTTLDKLKAKKAKLDSELKLLEELGITQYNQTDPDAKLMVKPAHNLMAYNTQIVVDSKWKFIVATDVSSKNNDNSKLHQMALKTKEIVNNDNMTLLADAGYYSAKEIDKCYKDNIDIYVPFSDNEKRQKDNGCFPHSKFIYNKDTDSYTCPNNQILTKQNAPIVKENGTKSYIYTTKRAICKACPLKDKCIPDNTSRKRVTHLEYIQTITEHKEKMQTKEAKEMMKKRASLAEHPFGTIKRALGWDHFLVRGLEKVSGENALIMFTYNFRRLLNILGITLFRELIKAIKKGNIEIIKPKIAQVLA